MRRTVTISSVTIPLGLSLLLMTVGCSDKIQEFHVVQVSTEEATAQKNAKVAEQYSQEIGKDRRELDGLMHKIATSTRHAEALTGQIQ